MASKSTRKLNQFTFHGTCIDGTAGSMRGTMYIETTGELRLFTELPAYLIASGVAGRTISHDKDMHVADGRLYGRDPARIKDRVQLIHGNYRQLLIEQRREKVIAVAFKARVPGDHAHNDRNDFSFVRHEFVLALDLEVYWQSGGKLYEFDGDDDRSMRAASGRSLDTKIIPYTDEAWATLQSIQSTLMDGTRRLRAMMASDELPALLARGPAALMAPQEVLTP